MVYKLNDIKTILNNTPGVLNSLLYNLPDELINRDIWKIGSFNIKGLKIDF